MTTKSMGACGVIISLLIASVAPGGGALAKKGGGAMQRGASPCVHPEDAAAARAMIEATARSLEDASGLFLQGVAPEKLRFYPMGGRLYRDLFTNNFVDLDPAPGFFDFKCEDQAYNGHDASDTDLRTFGEQIVGVPVFAALDGVVLGLVDGRPDMNTCPGTPCFPFAPNFIILGHAGGRRTQYYHLKKDSTLVSVGDTVKAGQQIGQVGSSGFSSWMHLHFAVYDNDGATVVEPFTGDCHAVETEWVEQPATPTSFYVRDFGVTHEDMNLYPGYPHAFPRSGQIAVDDPMVYYWFLPQFLPADSTWRVRFQRPDATIAFDSGTSDFGNPNPLRLSWWWHGWDIADMHSITGTWHILFDINGERVIDAPIEVRAARTPDFNHAPEPITAFLEPASPTDADVVFCRVNTPMLLDDKDYDIVRFHYVWEVDDVVVRDVTTAAQSDAVPHHIGPPGAVLSCTVTPSDGIAGGASFSTAATIGASAPPPPLGADDLCQGGLNHGATCSVDADCPAGACGLKSRYISITAPPLVGRGVGTASIKVTIASMPSNPAREGEVWWAGSSGAIPNPPHTDLVGAELHCEPTPSHAENWSGVIHLFGQPIAPRSTYEVRLCDASGVACSAALTVGAGRWGDVVAPFDAGSANFADISAIVEKFRGAATAPATPRVDLAGTGSTGQAGVPSRTINFADVSAGVDAFRGVAYPHVVPACP